MHKWIKQTAAALTLLTLAAPMLADELEACRTNFGDDGKVYLDLYTMVSSPIGYDELSVEGAKFEVFNTIRMGLQTTVWAYPAHKQRSGDVTDLKPIFHFIQNGAPVYSCAANLHTFDAQTVDLSNTGVGDCDFELEDGLPDLIVGQGQIYKLPKKLVEVSTAPGKVLNLSSLSDEIVWLQGLSAGSAQFLWMGRENNTFPFRGLCPFTVVDEITAQSAGTKQLPRYCTDSDGNPLHMSVGEYAKLAYFPYSRSLLKYNDRFSWPDAPLQIVTKLEDIELSDTASFEVRAIRPGKMSLAKRAPGFKRYQTCIITVE